MKPGFSTRAKRSDRAKLCGNGLARLAKGLKKQWKCYQKGLRRCQQKLSEEATHDLRVETRRLLATLELLNEFLPAKPVKQIASALKEHLDEFDDLRDTQVGLKLAKPLRDRFAVACEFHKHLLDREERFTRRAHKRIKKVKLGQVREWVRNCRQRLEERTAASPRERANTLLLHAVTRTFARVGRYRAAVDARDTRTIHRTRVAFKHFRYMVEALADCLPIATKRRLDAMRDYQTLMGDVQDAQVLLSAVDKFLRKRDVEPRTAVRFRKELLWQRNQLIKRYLAGADSLDKFWPA